MTHSLAPLILDFLEWLSPAPRPYADVMEAWRTSCPRLTVWEDATEQGFVARTRSEAEWLVEITPAGRDYLRAHRAQSIQRVAEPLSRARNISPVL